MKWPPRSGSRAMLCIPRDSPCGSTDECSTGPAPCRPIWIAWSLSLTCLTLVATASQAIRGLEAMRRMQPLREHRRYFCELVCPLRRASKPCFSSVRSNEWPRPPWGFIRANAIHKKVAVTRTVRNSSAKVYLSGATAFPPSRHCCLYPQ